MIPTNGESLRGGVSVHSLKAHRGPPADSSATIHGEVPLNADRGGFHSIYIGGDSNVRALAEFANRSRDPPLLNFPGGCDGNACKAICANGRGVEQGGVEILRKVRHGAKTSTVVLLLGGNDIFPRDPNNYMEEVTSPEDVAVGLVNLARRLKDSSVLRQAAVTKVTVVPILPRFGPYERNHSMDHETANRAIKNSLRVERNTGEPPSFDLVSLPFMDSTHFSRRDGVHLTRKGAGLVWEAICNSYNPSAEEDRATANMLMEPRTNPRK